jgi:hypothetical protein
MALSDLTVFNEQLFSLVTEILDQQVQLFNAATFGGIVLASKPFGGDYSDASFFVNTANLVRRRNPYGTGTISNKSLTTLIETMVKVAAGTPTLDLAPGQFNWIKQNPDLAAATWAKQMAPQILADMLNVAIGSVEAALAGVAGTNVFDATGLTTPADKMTIDNQLVGNSKLGDRASEIRCWLMHSKPWFDLTRANAANTAILFKYDTVKVMSDPLGNPFVIADLPALVLAGTPNVYSSIGLQENGVAINTNDDYDQIVVEAVGDENIGRKMQSEWSYNVGVKGFTWDKVNGGHAPTDAALFTAGNWDKVATSFRDLAGVLVKTH